jgi:hypothetical protein
MAESKSAQILNDFNGFSDETADSAPGYINRVRSAVRIDRPEKMSPAGTWARHCKELRCASAAFKLAVSKPSAIIHALPKIACLGSHDMAPFRGAPSRASAKSAPRPPSRPAADPPRMLVGYERLLAPEAVVQETNRVGLDPPRDRAQSRCSSGLCMATRGPWRRFSPP